MTEQQNQFKGFAIVELFGHQQIAGHVTTEYYGTACLFRVDVPALPERETELKSAALVEVDGQSTYLRQGAKVKRVAEPGYTRLLGPGAIYALNPCTEETVLEFIDRNRKLPPVPLDLVGAKARELAAPPAEDEEDEDDYDEVRPEDFEESRFR